MAGLVSHWTVRTRENRRVHIELETERLILRRFTAADLDDLVELDSDPHVMRFLTGGEGTPRHRIRDEVLPRLLSEYDTFPGWGRWAAVERASGAFLGWLGLDPPKGDRPEVELGYRLRRAAWGHGYATEGSRALVDQAFSATTAERVWAETMAVNTGSRRVMENAGLKLVRTSHPTWDPIEGAEHGEVEYELSRTDWERRQSAQ